MVDFALIFGINNIKISVKSQEDITMEVNPSSNKPPANPMANDKTETNEHIANIGSVATPRMPLVATAPQAEHNFDLSPTEAKTLGGLMPWMQIEASSAPTLGKRAVRHLGERATG